MTLQIGRILDQFGVERVAAFKGPVLESFLAETVNRIDWSLIETAKSPLESRQHFLFFGGVLPAELVQKRGLGFSSLKPHAGLGEKAANAITQLGRGRDGISDDENFANGQIIFQ